jgi:thiamine pyrophosphokinase
MMKRAIIFYNGDLSNLQKAKQYINSTDFIVCADGGANHATKLGIKPDVIIGDFDSLPEIEQKKFAKQKVQFITFEREKDETDSELAIQFAIKKGFKTILIFGLFGSRIDHMLTNIFSLDFVSSINVNVTMIEGNQEIRVIKNKIKLYGKKNDLVSLIPLKGDAKQVTTKNLQYPLKNETLKFGYSRGISNVFTKATAEISLREGSLLVIHSKN